MAGAVLASLGAVTVSKWCSEVSRRRAANARASRSAAVAVAGKEKLKDYPEYTIDTVRLHSSAQDAWVVVGDGVYDVTKWAPRHPGGERNIVDISGRYDDTGLQEVLCVRLPKLRAIVQAPFVQMRIALFARA